MTTWKIDMQVTFGQQSENLGIRPVLEFSSCVNLGKSVNLSETQTPHVGNNIITQSSDDQHARKQKEWK